VAKKKVMVASHCGGQALCLGEAITGACRQLGGLGEALQARPHVGEARGDAFDRLCVPGVQVIRVIQDAELADQLTRLGLSRLCLRVLGFGLHPRGQGRLDAGLEGGRAT